jgi:hypothetical protein
VPTRNGDWTSVADQHRRRDQHDADAARDTPGELNAFARLCEASEQMGARNRWLRWLDENDH